MENICVKVCVAREWGKIVCYCFMFARKDQEEVSFDKSKLVAGVRANVKYNEFQVNNNVLSKKKKKKKKKKKLFPQRNV